MAILNGNIKQLKRHYVPGSLRSSAEWAEYLQFQRLALARDGLVDCNFKIQKHLRMLPNGRAVSLFSSPSHGVHLLHQTSQFDVDIQGGSEIVVNWLNGRSIVQHPSHNNTVESISNFLGKLWRLQAICSRQPASNWFRHVYRELNGKADFFLTRASDQSSYQQPPIHS